MKYCILSLLLFFATGNTAAQDFASDFIQKYGDKELEVVNIGKQMLAMLGEMSGNNKELQEAIQGLESIKIISSNSKEKIQKTCKNAKAMLNKKSSGFSEMLSVKENEEETYIMIREEDDVVKDFVLLTSNDSTFHMICLTGDINMATLGKLASGGQLEKLKILNADNKQDSKNK